MLQASKYKHNLVTKLVALISLETTIQTDAKDLRFECGNWSGNTGSTIKSESLFKVVMKLGTHNKQFVGFICRLRLSCKTEAFRYITIYDLCISGGLKCTLLKPKIILVRWAYMILEFQ